MTFKKVACVAVMALALAACSTSNANEYQSGDKTFRSGQAK